MDARTADRDAPTETSDDVREGRRSAGDLLRRHPYAVAAAATAVLLILVAAAAWWLHARNYESTDDAFIDARSVTVAPQVTGAIVKVPVTDNQVVPAGAVLAEIDPRDFLNALAQAKAQVDQAVTTVANLDAQLDAQNAHIDGARASAAAATRPPRATTGSTRRGRREKRIRFAKIAGLFPVIAMKPSIVIIGFSDLALFCQIANLVFRGIMI